MTPSHDERLAQAVHRGDTAHQQGRWDEALAAYDEALALEPKLALVHYHRALVLARTGRAAEAVDAMHRSLALEPGRAKARIALGELLGQSGRHREALAEFRQVVDSGLDRPELWARIAKLEYNCGRAWPAAQAYARAAAGGDPVAESNRLYTSAFCSQVDAASLAALCRDWGQRAHERAMALPGPRWKGEAPRLAGRRIRIGYVSRDFREHSVRFFFMPLLRHHDRGRFDVTCYHDTPKRDAAHLALRGVSEDAGDEWVEASGMDDDALAGRILDDGIDVLVDLAGHSRSNRLALFARRLAPLQVTALGYPPTTGLPVMDLKLSDAIADPPGADAYYSEKLLRLDAGFWCFEPPADAPPVAPAPCAASGVFTFGCYGEAAKISDAVLTAWAGIFRRAPLARLLVKAPVAGDADLRAALAGRFADAGLPMDRVTFTGATVPLKAFLAEYARVDAILDTWPFNGGTTTCLALWMGVPVLGVAGDMLCSRMGASMLTRVGLADWVAPDAAAHVDAAVQLANEPARAASLRAGLRERVARSPLVDGRAWVRQYEDGIARALQ
ncbi:MAG: tetratricopeptide repeat protein [Burkholderiales bacterium]|nr:tetratricopeptide repeat protein [Burkholderiales bacterium]